MKKTKLILFSFIVLLCSCKKGDSYSKFYKDFKDNQWETSDKKEFDFDITDDSRPYDITLKFSHSYDYQFGTVPLDIDIIDPHGREEKIPFDLKIKDEKGKPIAECAGDICDLKQKIKEKATLFKGNYKVTISSAFKGSYLPGIFGVGIDVSPN